MTDSLDRNGAQSTTDRQPWTAPRLRALPVSQTETGLGTGTADLGIYQS